ncbi:hypothetical protein GCM10009595_16870 [Falsarthrobacter nasiphocae]
MALGSLRRTPSEHLRDRCAIDTAMRKSLVCNLIALTALGAYLALGSNYPAAGVAISLVGLGCLGAVLWSPARRDASV